MEWNKCSQNCGRRVFRLDLGPDLDWQCTIVSVPVVARCDHQCQCEQHGESSAIQATASKYSGTAAAKADEVVGKAARALKHHATGSMMLWCTQGRALLDDRGKASNCQQGANTGACLIP
jgi:hypothetical protein